MKSRHISGINDRLAILVSELIELAEKAHSQQVEFGNKSNLEFQQGMELAKLEGEKMKSLLHRIDNEDWTEQEHELLTEHFETQKKFTLYITEKIQERATIDAQLNELMSDSSLFKMQTIKHKKDILEMGIRRYYEETGQEKNRILDILYDMIEDIEENSFYNHAMKMH